MATPTPTITYDYNTGKPLAPGQAQSVYNSATGQKIGVPNPTQPQSPIPKDSSTSSDTPVISQDTIDYNNALSANTVAQGMTTAPADTDRSAATAMFQSEIDALNQVYAQQKQAETLAGNNRLGSNAAIEARRGLLGSDFGAAATDSQVAANADAQNAIDAKHNADIAAVYGKINQSALDLAKARVEATQKGAQAKLDEIKGRQTATNDALSSAAKAYIAAGNDGSQLSTDNVKKIADTFAVQGINVSSDQIINAFKDAVTAAQTAKNAAAKDALDQVKTQADINKINADIANGQRDSSKPIEVGGYIYKYQNGNWVNSGTKYDPTASPGTPATTGSVPNDVQAVLEGRNTLYNIRQTMGRTNAAAAYMKSMRDQITAIDPNFDFVASDAGGKSVSTTYVQKSMAAIDSVLPNINKITDLSSQVARIGITGVDNLIQKGGLIINNQKVANFREAQKLISDEIGVALGAGTVSDMKLQLGYDITDPSVSPEVFASNMGIVKTFLENRRDGLNSLRYKSSTVGSGGVDTGINNPSNQVMTSPDGTQQVKVSDLTPAQIKEAKK